MKSLITFFVLIITFSFVNAQDLIRNGGFENSNHFEFWDANVSVTGASVEPVNTQAHLGSWSVEIKSGTSPVGGWTQLLQTLLTPSNNIDYRLVFWVKDSVTTSNFLGVYGLTGTDEVALGIDSLNNTGIIDPDSGRITITQEFFPDWIRLNYFFNSGQGYNDYLLKFEEATSGNSQTVYLDDFLILPLPGQGTVQVTSPNGGEDWLVGSQQNITWTSSNVTNVKIEYSADNGVNWLNVVSSVPAASGSYSWTIPNTPSTECLVRIRDVANASVFDISDNTFTISPTINVTTPNGGEDWTSYEQQDITWTSQDITNVKIEYSTDNGSAWFDVVASVPAASGTYSWTIPNTPSTECLVRISDAGNASINDVSDATFTISSSLTVIAPNGGEVWTGLDQQDITWTSQDITNVKIEYSTDNGGAWLDVIASVPAASGTYSWTIPDTPSAECLVRISDASNASINDVSDATFTILSGPSITVITPNGGENWVANTDHDISWTRQDVSLVKIEYSTDNGGVWLDVITSTPAVFGNYNWTVPNTPSTQCLVRISDVSNPSVFDVSDGTFTIADPVSVEDLKSGIPEEYALLQNYPNPFNPTTRIRFSIPTANKVTIDVFTQLGEKVATVLNSNLSAGYYEFEFDAMNLPSGMYFYKISSGNFTDIKKMVLIK
ncbi:MAG: T9SS type A sorting domain-containing protein [Ignavibacteria bacterium]|nr:T9SS type A sorting domain-containing protein [Ignavibacteria bacterium]